MFCCCFSQSDSDNQQPLLTQTNDTVSLSEHKHISQPPSHEFQRPKQDQSYSSHEDKTGTLDEPENKMGLSQQMLRSQSMEEEEKRKSYSVKKILKQEKSRKSKLWEEEPSSDLIYYKISKGSCRFLSFLLKKKNAINTTDIIEYLLKKSSDKLNLVISKEFVYESKSYENTNNTFVLFKGNHYKSKNMEMVKARKISAIRFNIFDQIIIVNSKMDSSEQIMSYCFKITQQLTFQQVKNLIYIFPSSFTLHQISTIIFKNLEKFIKGQPMEKIISDLTLQMELIGNGNLDPSIIVKHRSQEAKAQSLLYDQRKLSLVLLLKDHHKSTFQLHKSCYHSIKSKSINEFMELVDQVHINPSKIQTLFSVCNEKKYPENIQLIEREEEKGCFIAISKKSKENIEYFYRHPKSIQSQKHKTDSDTPIKKEWDDDLDGFRIPGIKQEDKDSNDLQIIGDEQLDEMSVELDLVHTDDDQREQKEEEEVEMNIKSQ